MRLRSKTAKRIELACGLTVAVIAWIITLQVVLGHHPAPAAEQAPTGPSAEQVAFDRNQAAFAAQLAVLNAKYGCITPDTWTVWRPRLHQFPAHMIVQPVTAAGLPTWDVVVKPWSMANAGGYVKGLCVR